jgi:hypothetical protein
MCKWLDHKDLCHLSQTCTFFHKLASQDFLYRFLLQNKKLTFLKGFKQSWLQVYKLKLAQTTHKTKEGWNYDLCT